MSIDSHFSPTSVSKDGRVAIYAIAYSEHSSYNELSRFIKSLNVLKIIPTVNNGNEKSRMLMNSYFKKWKSNK